MEDLSILLFLVIISLLTVMGLFLLDNYHIL